MHAKLQNGFLRSASKTITLDGKTINNPLPEELEQLGYKPVVYTDMPTEVTEGKHWESEWVEGETEITQEACGRSDLPHARADTGRKNQ